MKCLKKWKAIPIPISTKFPVLFTQTIEARLGLTIRLLAATRCSRARARRIDACIVRTIRTYDNIERTRGKLPGVRLDDSSLNGPSLAADAVTDPRTDFYDPTLGREWKGNLRACRKTRFLRARARHARFDARYVRSTVKRLFVNVEIRSFVIKKNKKRDQTTGTKLQSINEKSD